MMIRISKMLLVAAMALFATLVTFNNLTDYDGNFQFVEHVFMMDTTYLGNALMYRAIHTPILHHIGYIVIIVLEAGIAVLCWSGAWRLYKARAQAQQMFQRAKKHAIAGLTLGALTWQVIFMTIGSEWFAMGMSEDWNGAPNASRFLVTMLLVLIYVSLRNDELDAEEDGSAERLEGDVAGKRRGTHADRRAQ